MKASWRPVKKAEVDVQTVRKYLALDFEDDAPIPFNDWFRLPSDHIQIIEWFVLELTMEAK
jgi:hypothetical protein